MLRHYRIGMIAAVLLAGRELHAQTLAFNVTASPNVSQSYVNAVREAGAQWSSRFRDPVTINIEVQTAALGNTLASASSSTYTVSYANFRDRLGGDATTADDNNAMDALNNFWPGDSVVVSLNYTTENPFGSGSDERYFDNNGSTNNTLLEITSANAKAVGVLEGDDPIVDLTITFSTDAIWDFDPTDGISGGAYDFVGTATHEIGHAMGFLSTADTLDKNAADGLILSEDAYLLNSLDLFRNDGDFMPAIQAGPDVRQFLFLDGFNPDYTFANGSGLGSDGHESSHWQDGRGLGIMDPTQDTGERLLISNTDVRAFDIIGWDPIGVVPAPPALLVFAGGLLASVGPLLRRRKK